MSGGEDSDGRSRSKNKDVSGTRRFFRILPSTSRYPRTHRHNRAAPHTTLKKHWQRFCKDDAVTSG